MVGFRLQVLDNYNDNTERKSGILEEKGSKSIILKRSMVKKSAYWLIGMLNCPPRG